MQSQIPYRHFPVGVGLREYPIGDRLLIDVQKLETIAFPTNANRAKPRYITPALARNITRGVSLLPRGFRRSKRGIFERLDFGAKERSGRGNAPVRKSSPSFLDGGVEMRRRRASTYKSERMAPRRSKYTAPLRCGLVGRSVVRCLK